MKARSSLINPKAYVDNFKHAIVTIAKVYKKQQQKEHDQLIPIIENECSNINLQATDLWDLANKHRNEIYSKRWLPKFMVLDELGLLFDYVLDLYPRNEVERNEHLHLFSLNINSQFNIESVLRENKILKNHNNFLTNELLQTKNQNATLKQNF